MIRRRIEHCKQLAAQREIDPEESCGEIVEELLRAFEALSDGDIATAIEELKKTADSEAPE